MSVLYHPGKDNVVVDALSLITIGSVSHIDDAKKDLVKDVHRLARLVERLEDSSTLRMVVSSFATTPSHH